MRIGRARIACIALSIAALAAAGWPAHLAAATDSPIDVAVIWHVGAPSFGDRSVQTAAVALTAPVYLGAALRAVRRHPGARIAVAMDGDQLAALERAAAGSTLLADVAAGKIGLDDPRNADLLQILSRSAPAPASLWHTPGGRRYGALLAAAPLALAGDRAAAFSRRDLSDFVATAAWMWLAGAGNTSAAAGLARSDVDPRAALAQLARADDSVARLLKEELAGGAVELVATPANETVLPLLVDAAGKSSLDPNIVDVRLIADASRLVDDAIGAVRRFAGGARAVGLYSPFGAYDDATAELLQNHHVAYALFTDRVVKAMSVAASADTVATADAAGLHAYSLHVSKSGALPALFWTEDVSASLAAVPATWPTRALADRLVAAARSAAATPNAGARVLTVNVEAGGTWSRRADYESTVDAIAAALTTESRIRPTTPGEFLRAHPAATAAYGFPPASSAGSFSLWMGSFGQAALWSSLVSARTAAGGDAALERDATRDALLQAEGSRWFETLQLPASAQTVRRDLAAYRGLLARVYRSAGRPVPSNLAQVRLETPPVLNVPQTPTP